LFASGDSCTSAKLRLRGRGAALDGSIRDPNALHMMMLEQVRQRVHEFDFLHFHLDYYPFSMFSRQSVPFVTTLHGRLDLPEHQPVFSTFSSVPVISISNAQRGDPEANWVRTIAHGLPERLLVPQATTPQYFAFSVASPRRRASIARSGSRALRRATQDRGEGRRGRPRVFRGEIRPSIDSRNVEYIARSPTGEVGIPQRRDRLAGAIDCLSRSAS